MIWFVARDQAGTVVFASQESQEGYANEKLDDQSSAELANFLNPPSALCAKVDALRDARLAAGFADATTGKVYECDDQSIGRWDAMGSAAGLAIVMAIDPAPTFPIITADNSIVMLSAIDAFALFQGRIMAWVSATVLHARAVKDAILAGNAPADMTQGWP